MSRLTLDGNREKLMVWVGDSKAYSSDGGTLSGPYKRWGDRHARDLAVSGVRRFRDGWSTTETTYGSAPYDLVYRGLHAPGFTASGWTTSSVATSLTSANYNAHIDYLICNFGGNDYNDNTGPTAFYNGVLARLNDWPNAARKYLFVGTVNGDIPGNGGAWTRAVAQDADAYWEAARDAAADADPGYRQSTVKFRSLFGVPYFLCDNGAALTDWTYDRTHLTSEGARRYFLDFRRAIREG